MTLSMLFILDPELTLSNSEKTSVLLTELS